MCVCFEEANNHLIEKSHYYVCDVFTSFIAYDYLWKTARSFVSLGIPHAAAIAKVLEFQGYPLTT